IRAILALLMSDNRDAQLKNERERIRQLLAHLDRVLRETKVMRAQTEAGRADKEALVKGQEKVAKDTGDLAKAMGKGQESKDKPIQTLEEARRRLEEILRQLREEEQQRLLAALQARCEQMLVLQLQVYDGTVRVDRAVAQNPDKRPTRAEEQRALQLSDREQD